MILVDSSVWIDFFNNTSSKTGNFLDSALINNIDDICVTDIIMTEILQGIRQDSQYAKIKNALLEFQVLSHFSLDIYIKASEIFRITKSKGYTIRSTIDCIIAAQALHHNCQILTQDKDFKFIAKCIPLQILKI